jgi:hypothetical protein
MMRAVEQEVGGEVLRAADIAPMHFSFLYGKGHGTFRIDTW